MDDQTKVLNLYAGIGGNRKFWTNVDVTAVERDEKKARVYRDHFPNDEVVVTDAHKYLLNHYNEYDFIWASPPCPTHSRIRKLGAGEGEQNDAVYPDMKLYQEILFLDGYFDGKYAVENVKPWYDPLIDAYDVGRHYIWSNFHVPDIEIPSQNNQYGSVPEWEKLYGFDLSKWDFNQSEKQKMLRNCVHPRLGEHVFQASKDRAKQETLGAW